MDKYIITLIGFDYENKTDNFEVINDMNTESFAYETELSLQQIKNQLNEFISDVFDKLGENDKEELVDGAFSKCKLPFAVSLRQMAMDNEGLTYRIDDYGCYEDE